MTDLDDTSDLGPLARRIEPLPGGLGQLRDRLRGHRSRRVPIALAVAASCCAVVAIWLLRTPAAQPAPDRTAMRRLLVDADQQPNPRAVAMGLVAPSTPTVATDPRVTPSDSVVFYWVAPAQAQTSY
jgi:hypothetical protein